MSTRRKDVSRVRGRDKHNGNSWYGDRSIHPNPQNT